MSQRQESPFYWAFSPLVSCTQLYIPKPVLPANTYSGHSFSMLFDWPLWSSCQRRAWIQLVCLPLQYRVYTVHLLTRCIADNQVPASVWTCIEPAIGIVTACLPNMGPLLQRVPRKFWIRMNPSSSENSDQERGTPIARIHLAGAFKHSSWYSGYMCFGLYQFLTVFNNNFVKYRLFPVFIWL